MYTFHLYCISFERIMRKVLCVSKKEITYTLILFLQAASIKVCACVVIRSLLNNVTIVCVVSYCMYLNIQIVYLDPNATPYLSLDYSPWDSNSLSRQFTLYFHICGTCSVCKLLFWRWSDDQYQSRL